MTFSTAIEKKLTRTQRDLADDILDYDDFDFYRIGDDWVGAVIEGESPKQIHVGFHFSDDKLQFQCTCDVFRKFKPQPCGHILAAVRLAEESGVIDRDGTIDPDLPVRGSGGRFGSNGADLPFVEPVRRTRGRKKQTPPRPPEWRSHLATLQQIRPPTPTTSWPAGREVLYIIDAYATIGEGVLAIETNYRERKKDGEWSKPKSVSMNRTLGATVPNSIDRRALAMLLGAGDDRFSYGYYEQSSARHALQPDLAGALLPVICPTGRCLLRGEMPEDLAPLSWDDGGTWDFRLHVRRDDEAQQYVVSGEFVRGEARMPLSEPVILTAGGLLFTRGSVGAMDDHDAFQWIVLLRKKKELRVPYAQGEEFLKELYRVPRLPAMEVPEDLKVEEVRLPMKPRLQIKAPGRGDYGAHLRGELSFDYGGTIVNETDPARGLLMHGAEAGERRLIVRDPAAEAAANDRVRIAGFKLEQNWNGAVNQAVLRLAPNKLPGAIRLLAGEGWHIEAEGKLYRQPGEMKLELTSGIDWFDLQGNVTFGDQSATLPQLLAALRKGDKMVQLGDGTFGMLPEEWLRKYAPLAAMGTPDDKSESLRFGRTQVGLLDVLLASQPEATFDAGFARVRDELRNFDGIKPGDAPPTFRGELRPYQRDALGWFDFLRRFGFGGCLADDMGLGKTVQILSLLESRRLARQEASAIAPAPPDVAADAPPPVPPAPLDAPPAASAPLDAPPAASAPLDAPPAASAPLDAPPAASAQKQPPSLVVVPRSLIFNWQQEAARFAPELRVLDHSLSARARTGDHFTDYDVVLTTYGTLRRDAAYLKDFSFDHVILDEAQAIKNPASESAKAVRLLKADHRLCLSGTPVQNHLGDLWSLFDFLNPGMLGNASIFSGASSGLRNPDPETRDMLARGLRPFILRRTKEQVASDLPPKLEQTIYCELSPSQRKLYDELREHYRRSLLSKIATDGINKSKIMILEALLRLRQAACHPGLIDKKRAEDPSAKLDTLMARLEEVSAEGHKALVFSQFTSFLALVKTRLDKDGIKYEYLDGRTKDRQQRVDHFQQDPSCGLFLISLKAGGLGLNLTAADYVFLLDPWWNPAVEAQAIDRSHRIGQTRNVFACRLIAKDTVEEKVLALQQTKRELADAILNADNSLIRTLGREDLEMLLS